MIWYARVYPNGEFGIGRVEKKEFSELLGSSDATKSHSEVERAKRGSKGISSYGRKMVRNACYLLERRYGRECLAFLTFTLPSMTREENEQVCAEWAEIVRITMQSLRRKLRSVGLPGHIVGCVEVQPQRFERDKGMPLHLHCTFKAKKSKWVKGWPIQPAEYREIWRRAVCARVPSLRFSIWNAAENVKGVRKSAEAYLGKYLSKGVEDLAKVEEMGLGHLLPSAWWVCSAELKECIKANTIYSSDVAEFILARKNDQGQWAVVDYIGEVRIVHEGQEICLAYYGRLADKWTLRKLLGLEPWGEYEWNDESNNMVEDISEAN